MFAGLMSSRGRKAEKRVGPGKAQIGGLFVVFFWRGSRIVVLGTFRIEWFERTAKGKPCPSLKDSPNSNLKAHPGAMLPCRKQVSKSLPFYKHHSKKETHFRLTPSGSFARVCAIVEVSVVSYPC